MQPEGFILFLRCKTSMMGALSAQTPDSRAYSEIYLFAVRRQARRGGASGGRRPVSGVLLGLLLTAVDPALQLRLDIQADRYLQAGKGIREQDFEGAKEAINRIPAFQAQHGLEIPEQFFSGTRRYWIGLSSTKQRPRA